MSHSTHSEFSITFVNGFLTCRLVSPKGKWYHKSYDNDDLKGFYMKLNVIVNPAGASGKTAEKWKKLEPFFRESGADYEVHFSEKEDGIGGVCRRLEREHFGAGHTENLNIITVGGDGSVNEAINGFDDISHINYAHLPGGSGNDMLRDMALPKDTRELVRRIASGKAFRYMDIGEVSCPDTGFSHRFAVSAGLGFDAGVCEQVSHSGSKAILNRLGLGKLIYVADAFKIILTQDKALTTLTTPEGTYTFDHTLLIAIMNHQFEGGGIHFAPKADFADGKLNLCLAVPKRNTFFYRALPFALFGKHESLKFIETLVTSEFEVKASLPLWLHTDGEPWPKTDHIKVRILDTQLAILM